MNNKNGLMLISGLLLIPLIFGLATSLHAQADVQQTRSVTLLSYQQQGQFGYSVTSQPPAFSGAAATTAPVTSPQVPTAFIQSLNVTFYYQPGALSGRSIEINAILENPGYWDKSVNLVPQKAYSGSGVNVALDLASLQALGDTIDQEIGLTSSTRTLTIQAVVSGGDAADFVQLLPITWSRTFIKMGDALTQASGGESGRFDYAIKLSDNTLFGAVTLTPPVQTSVPDVTLGPDDTIFTHLIDSMTLSYNYALTSDQTLSQTSAVVQIDAVLENPGSWTQTYNLVPATTETGSFSLNFPVDVALYEDIFNSLQQQTGLSAQNENLTIQATVQLTAQSADGPVDQTFTQAITTDLDAGVLSWSGDLKKTSPGSITENETATQSGKLWGQSVEALRFIFGGGAVLMIALFLVGLVGSVFFGGALAQAEKRDRELENKYRDIIIEAKELPEITVGEKVLLVSSLDELIKTSQGLLKPILHLADKGGDTYCVFDGSVRYCFMSSKSLA